MAKKTKSPQHTESSLEQEYRSIGYASHHNPMSADSLKEYPECSCKKHMRYIGLIKGNSQIAIAHCDHCGEENEF